MVDIVSEVTKDTPALSILMPDVFQESISDTYQDLNEIPIKDLLKTHVLSSDGRYLYPVSLILETELMDERRNALPFNPYYDFMDVDTSHAEIDSATYQRIQMHSSLTEAIIDTQQQYQKFSSNENTLLGQLTRLVQQLGINAVGGLGEETNAGAGAYPAIISFSEYYGTLPDEEKAKLTEKLKEEIDLLLNLSSDSESNLNATKNVATCLATRRTEMLTAMDGHGELLGNISVGEEKSGKLMNDLETQFKEAKDALKGAISDTATYKGRDALGITGTLLDRLKVPIEIKSVAELNWIVRGSSISALGDVLQRDDVKMQVMQQLSSIETFPPETLPFLDSLAIFIMETPGDKVPVFLDSLQAEIMPFITSPTDLGTFLSTLDVEKIKITVNSLNLLKKDLPKILQSGESWGTVMKFLPPEQGTVFLEAMKYLSDDQRSLFLETMEKHLPKIIKSGADFSGVMDGLSDEQRPAFLDIMEEHLPKITKSRQDFGNIMQSLSPKKSAVFLETMEKHLPKIIKSGADFSGAMKSLSDEQRPAFLAVMEKHLSKITKTRKDFGNIIQSLSPKQSAVFLEAMKGKLPDIIKSEMDFGMVMQSLSPEQGVKVYEALLANPPKNLNLDEAVVNELSEGQKDAIQKSLASTKQKDVTSTFKEKLSAMKNDGNPNQQNDDKQNNDTPSESQNKSPN
jgi:hypothetical protein